MSRWMVVGLGNPGPRFRETRHNAGFWVVEALAQASGIGLKRRRKLSAWLGEGERKGQRVILVKPFSFINISGLAIKKVMDYFQVPWWSVLIIVDDVNLPPGKLRIRARGGAGGHHGLESVIEQLGSNDFPRLRLGIGGGEKENLTGHVLSRFGKEERRIYEEVTELAVQAVDDILESGLEFAMNKFN